ncbi:phage tail assembly protein T [Thalassoglobus neptunius]|uniref:phage tail assembly protein T n=1 Tax=Thalassoglobus neptunius TaxID=1938619 RepID=UPI0011B73F16|nr:hypothetical protein [Thalassoglobus neptunius]
MTQLTRRQLHEWLAFHAISPIGERRADTRSAVQTAWIRRALVEDEDHSPDTFRPQLSIYEDYSTVSETPEQIEARERREADQFRC